MSEKTPSTSPQKSPTQADLLALKQEKLILKERLLALREGLPFLHGWKWYPWAREFFESRNKLNFLCAANQISKSSTQIRKAIHWATAGEEMWHSLWGRPPVQFWYLYPTNKQVRAEFETKWQQFLPKGKYKTDAEVDGRPNLYAWDDEWMNKELYCINFFVAGVRIYFKTYSQDVAALQTGTCDALFCDEELPVELYDELIFRISASDGYFHMVFTATIGQDYWRQVMEPEPGEQELLPHAAKWTVSMYDCLKYEDGSPSHWTAEKIQTVINRCQTHNEVLKRVHGKFIMESGGRKYEQFDPKRHVKPWHPIPKEWMVFVGVDVGSGGAQGHKSAICFVAVRNDFREARVFHGWRGDGVLTSAGHVVDKYQEMHVMELGKRPITGHYYDWACKDFHTIASGRGLPFAAADKNHEKGEQILNTLFKNDMLFIYDTPELQKLVRELSTLRRATPKKDAKDDFCDALRYAVTLIPWDWESVGGEVPEPVVREGDELSPMERELAERRKRFEDEERAEQDRIEDEFAEANELCGE